jgi:hypothetical protein
MTGQRLAEWGLVVWLVLMLLGAVVGVAVQIFSI